MKKACQAQESYHQQTSRLIDTITKYGNPFLDDYPELLVLRTRDCVDESIVSAVKKFETVGKNQYKEFKDDVLEKRTRAIHDPMTRNSLPLFSTPRQKKDSAKAKQLAQLKNDVSLFGQLYIANQLRNEDPYVFFSHENQLYPPSLSDNGKLRFGKKSDLLKCLKASPEDNVRNFDCKIFDGAMLAHVLPREGISTFQQYAGKVFIPFLKHELQPVNRVDIVWDRYLESSIKGATREKRGAGLRRKVNPQTKIPAKWNHFLRDLSNKVGLFSLLTDAAAKQKFKEEKELYITSDQSVISIGGSSEPMPICTHKEADTRIIVHLFHSVRRANKKILIRTVHADIPVILLGEFDKVSEIYPDLDLWIALGVGKDFTFYSINTIYNEIGAKKQSCCQCSTPFLNVTLLPPSMVKVKRVFGRHGKLFQRLQMPSCL